MIVDDTLGISWEKFLFMNTVVYGHIRWHWWGAHGGPTELFESKIAKNKDIQCHDKS